MNEDFKKFDWKITAFDRYGNVIDSWIIYNKTIKKATEKAMKQMPTDTFDWEIKRIFE